MTVDENDRLDPVGAFMIRMKEDWEDRLTNNPERYSCLYTNIYVYVYIYLSIYLICKTLYL
jgi:hypothetical protein